jgi:hypothetical protein
VALVVSSSITKAANTATREDEIMAGAWRTAGVFISSTFRDMHAERDHLDKVVFPELRERLLPYRVYLNEQARRRELPNRELDVTIARKTDIFLEINPCRLASAAQSGGE